MLVIILDFISQVQTQICYPEAPCSTCRFESTRCTNCLQGYYLLGDECVQCNYPCIGCGNAYSCYKCDDGYYLDTNNIIDECLPCNYPCLTCYQPTFCTSCGWEPHTRNDDRYCRCKQSYYELDQKCIQCPPPCIQCADLLNCFDCDNSNTGLYLNHGLCKPCVYPCLTCLSPNFCLKCGYDVDKRVQDQTCRCKDGWWDDGQECRNCIPPCNKCTSQTFCLWCTNEMTGLFANDSGICEKCWYPCITCTGYSDCLTCGWEPELRNVNWSCNCKIGYYECGTKCKPCIAPCKQCTSETNCKDCNNADSGTFYYYDYCRPCEYPCATCVSETTCLTCGFGPEKRINTHPCTCKEGYYEVGYQCALCIPPCIKCDSPTICHDCDQYNSGYYKNDENRCVRCPYPCENCKTPDYCYSCLPYLSNINTNDPKCSCLKGYFELDQECNTCKPPCRQCVGISIKCLTCIEGSYLVDGQNLCKYCVYPCITCSSETECITCGWGIKIRNQPYITGTYEYLGETRYHFANQSCPCKRGYYPHGKNCLPCVPPCISCSDQKTCITTNCNNIISQTYEQDGQCKPCQYPCKTCKNSPYQNQCYSCGYDSQRRDLYNYNCGCKDGYYEQPSEKICLPCISPCTKCSAANVCTVYDCQNSISGMYYNSSSKKCQNCEYPCKTCTSLTNCLQCGWDVENRNSSPNCECKNGWYDHQKQCLKCVLPCKTCTSQTECISVICDKHTSPETGQKITTGLGYRGNECVKCNYPCLTCSINPNHCRSCGYGGLQVRVQPDYKCAEWTWNGSCRYRYWDQDCRCKNGYYHRHQTQECLPCALPCRNCYSETQCTRQNETNWCNDSSSRLYISNIDPATCSPCSYPCITCFAGGRNCLKCGYGTEKRQPYYTTIIGRYSYKHGECYCLPGFYEEDQECKPCQKPCTNCTSLTECTAIYDCDKSISGLYPNNSELKCEKCRYPCKLCNSAWSCITCGYDVENRKDEPDCSCKDGFFDNGSQECIKCTLPCLTCTSVTNCLTIYDCDYTTSGYYAQDLECKQCEYPCNTCISQSICLTCGWDVENRNPPSHCSCKQGFFQSNQSCIPCQLPCVTCTDLDKCLTIYDCDHTVSGTYPDSTTKRCIKCEYPCITCSAPGVCHTCDGNLENRKLPPYCTCKDGYFHKVDQCIQCALPCLTCTDEITCLTYFDCDNSISGKYQNDLACTQCQYPCLNCKSQNFCLECDQFMGFNIDVANNSCTCGEGYYKQDNECLKCKLPCIKCYGPDSSQCITRYDCPEGMQRDYSTNLCQQCSYPCRTCKQGYLDRCTSCGWDSSRRETRNDYCVCKHGYYHYLEHKACYKCNYPCGRCQSATKCDSHLYISNCNYQEAGMYYQPNQNCKLCEYPCKTCSYGPTICYSCGYGASHRNPVKKYWKNSIKRYVWNRKCDCKSGYWHKEDTQECIPCIPPCITCSSQTQCNTFNCNNNNSGQFFDNSTNTCQFCKYPCKTCTDSENNCTSCVHDPSTRLSSPSCQCKNGYYQMGQICLQCKLPCKTCTDEKECIEYDCQSAVSGTYVFTPPNVNTWNDPACETMDYPTQQQNSCIFYKPYCKRCEYPCQTCTSQTDCLQCGYTATSRNEYTCGCKIDYYKNNEVECIQNGCTSPCVTCQSSGDCLTCIDGHFLLGNQCQLCPSDNNCLTCSDQNTCKQCGDKYYLEDRQCLPCPYPCIKCSAKTICLECGYDQEYRLQAPSCSCLRDYYDTGFGCVKCTAPCKTCTSSSQTDCLSCITGYYISGTICNFCPYSCSSCQDPLNCQSCNDGYFLRGVQCLPCQYPCETCMNQEFCYTCGYSPENRFRPPKCDCNYLDGFFYNGLKDCTKCEEPCRSCDPLTKICTSCIDSHYYISDGETKQKFVQDPDGEITKQIVQPDGETVTVKGIMVEYIYHGECKQCMEGCIKCEENSICQQCQDGYYITENTCIICKSPCATCISDTWCLTCGYGPELRYNPPDCKCFEQDSNNLILSDQGSQCAPCTSPCIRCIGLGVSECTQCEEYHWLDAGTCSPCHNSCLYCRGPDQSDCDFSMQIKCRAGFYPDIHDSDHQPCKACVYPCETCISPIYCYTCGYDASKRNGAPDCKCTEQYADDNINQRCNLCSHPCKTCNSQLTNDCKSCVKGWFLQDDGETCSQCDEECTSCQTNSNFCSQCTDGYYLSTNQCIQCVYPCQTCYSATKCHTCGYDNDKRLMGPTCACKVDFSEVGQLCIQCKSPCKKCDSADGESCIQCVHKYYLQGNSCINCPVQCKQCNSETLCTKCEDGYYLQGTDCLPCQAPCATCTNASFCLTCGFGPEKRIMPPSCACQFEYTEFLNQCIICTPPCKTCNGNTVNDCLSCVDEFWLDSSMCKQCQSPCKQCESAPDKCLSCIDTYFLDDSGPQNQCQQCVYPCINCYAINQCLTCGYGPENRTEPPSCACQFQFIEISQQCLNCESPCSTCGPQADKCKSCIQKYYLQGTECKQCEPSCLTCHTSPDNCQECISGYYLDTNSCIQCQFPCIECYGPNLCITCGGDPSQRIGPPLCECILDQWSDDRTLEVCVECIPPCRRCNSASINDCTMCIEEYYLEGTTCIACQTGCKYCKEKPENCSECIAGYYLDTDGETCKQCVSPCTECISATSCIICGYGPDLRTTAPLCNCLDIVDSNGKLLGDQGDQCVVCEDPCYKCNGTGPNNCLSCIDGFAHVIDDNSCMACQPGCIGCTLDNLDFCVSCFEGYFLRQNQCLICNYPCETCLEQDYCYTCISDPDNKRIGPPTCQCKIQYHDNGVECLTCTSPCKTCQDLQVNTCYSCIDSFYLDGEEGTMAQCQPCQSQCLTCKNREDFCFSCKDQYYLDTNQCKQCIYPCDTCLNETFCYTCGYDIANKNGPPTCSCKHGMSDTQDGETGCILCSDPCYTCRTVDQNDCLSCNENYYLQGSQCKPCYEGCNRCSSSSICQECNKGWYLDGESCIKCHVSCSSCYNGTSCITCENSVKRIGPPTCACQDTYYESTDGEGCKKCPQPGLVCDSATQYRTCSDGYYWKSDGETHSNGDQVTWHHPLSTGSCQPCQPPCQTCLNKNWCYQCTSATNRGVAPYCICDTGYYSDGETGQCETCVHPIKICDSKTIAVLCEDGWYIQGTECKACQYPCSTCLFLTTCLTCVDDVDRRDVPQCTCLPGYYDKKFDGTELNACINCPSPSSVCINDVEFLGCIDGYYQKSDTKTCEPCVHPCLHCVSEIFCTQCVYEPGKRELPQTCSCKYGEYYQADPNDTFCTPCSSSNNCDRCLSATHCLSCQDGFTLDGEDCIPCLITVGSPCSKCVGSICLSCGLDIEGSNTPSCDCLKEIANNGTYQECYDKNRTICPLLPCIPPCQNCVSQTNCTTCLDDDFRYDVNDGENSCKCLPGFQQNLLNKCNKICPSGQFGVKDQCYDCISPCSECDGEHHLCTDCVTGYKYYGNYQCILQCQFPCQTCTTPTQCITCAGLNRDGEDCSCQNGYFEDSNQLCQKCQNPCKNCDDLTTCTSCMDGEFRQGMSGNCQCQTGFNEFEGQCIKICQSGTYVNFDQCLDCHPQCKTCEGSGSNCLICSKGYFKQGLTCVRCSNNCQDCDGDGECTECDITQYGRQNILPSCPCRPGTFERGTTDCGICIDPCETCQENRINCITCIEGGVNRNPPPNCTCTEGSYDKNGTCRNCEIKCQTCEFQDNYCILCKEGGTGRNSTNPPECDCLPGYYNIQGQLDCPQCEYPCETCEFNSTNCLTCVFPTEQRNSANDCNCIDSYFRNQTDNCQNCSWKCKKCQNQTDLCTECNGENRLKSSCDCKIGYFGIDPDLTCYECQPQCLKCSNIANNCDECHPSPNRKPKPDCNCLSGYYLDSYNNCQKCQYPCAECIADKCLTCIDDGQDPYRHGTLQQCRCFTTYYYNGFQCKDIAVQQNCGQNQDGYVAIKCSDGKQNSDFIQNYLCIQSELLS